MDYDDDMMEDEMKPFYGGQCKVKKDMGQVYWRRENCMVKMGSFCELTGEYHWKSLVSCRSCDNRGGVHYSGHKYPPRSDIPTEFYTTQTK